MKQEFNEQEVIQKLEQQLEEAYKTVTMLEDEGYTVSINTSLSAAASERKFKLRVMKVVADV